MLHLLYLSGLLHIYIVIKLLLHATVYLVPSSLPKYLTSNPNAPESWALITGSTAGIGFGFAQELLSKGFNVIIHGKDHKELEHARTRLLLSFPHRSIRIFQYDAASSSTTTLAASLAPALQDISLRVLINNVGGQAGQTRSTYQRFADFSGKEVSRVMNVNAHFMTQITRIILPRFLSSQKEKEENFLPCLILNVSSLSATGLPYLSVYAASKAYVDAFTRSLHAEMLAEKAPVSVLGVVCGNVQSDGHRLTPGWFVPTSRAMARAALRCVGPASATSASTPKSVSALASGLAAASALRLRLGGQRALVTAYWPHAVQAWVFGILPEKAREWISISILRGLKADMEGEERRVR
ncbi:putative short chain dehydrogenase/reductase [Aspergillus affinis]|uniref:putative short chain dehydrogenase/reductase n=1 Tax=Aspergillus affinis TaxID=1070780 RepID=UPI0022FE04E2|nr:estradiol 17-beta-dehydrogenase 12-A [Aspergillus affinis]KAI9043978.1 estradiol 17-beta-dehydrogenase 12-A [Aspergillus affinis]